MKRQAAQLSLQCLEPSQLFFPWACACAYASKFVGTLQDLCRVMRKSNVLAAQVEVMHQQEQEAANWVG